MMKKYEADIDFDNLPEIFSDQVDGHSFGQGWYIVNEKGSKIFMDDEKEYKELYEKYMKTR